MSHWYQNYHFQQLSIPTTTDTSSLPPLSVMLLDNLAAVQAIGVDSLTYLQGQLTCDLAALDKVDSTLAAHCDSKGKVWSVLRVFHQPNGIGYVLPKSALLQQLSEIKKYAVFSKVEFVTDEQVVLGVAGEKADNAMCARFFGKGNVRHNEAGTAIRVEPNRWLLVMSQEEANKFIYDLGNRADLVSHHLWDYYELKAGIPVIEGENSNEFIPQSLNLQCLDAISFKKGCYTGQETVARAKYRGINKRAAYLLIGDVAKGNEAPKAGDRFERSVGENWRIGGTVLNGFLFSDSKAIAMVVLPNDLDEDTEFRQEDGENLWTKLVLPYSLQD